MLGIVGRLLLVIKLNQRRWKDMRSRVFSFLLLLMISIHCISPAMAEVNEFTLEEITEKSLEADISSEQNIVSDSNVSTGDSQLFCREESISS